MPVPEIDKLLGMEIYATKTPGVGGEIKKTAEDFIVEEILVDGSKASTTGDVPSRVLGSSLHRQRFLLCLLIKRNWDTFIAVKNVAKALGIDQSRIQFAGIKDAKALTAQYISIENISMDDVKRISVTDVFVRPIGYVREPLSLFYLLGNNFKITVESIHQLEPTLTEDITQTIHELDEMDGFPNFFGHQRFGTTRPISHLVGKALFRGDFEKAAMLFMASPSPNEHPASRQARQRLQSTIDFKKALESFPRQLRFERLMLAHLVENPEDFKGSFRRLPEKLQALFIQASQSYLFNRFVSERAKHGLPLNEAVIGDFVIGVERSGLPQTAVFKVVSSESLADANLQIKSGRLRVALPLYGVKQKLSAGIMGQIEKEVLTQEDFGESDIKVDNFKAGARGGLRAIITPISNFTLQKVSGNGDSSSAKISFMLYRGTYATVVLREIMKPNNPAAQGF